MDAHHAILKMDVKSVQVNQHKLHSYVSFKSNATADAATSHPLGLSDTFNMCQSKET